MLEMKYNLTWILDWLRLKIPEKFISYCLNSDSEKIENLSCLMPNTYACIKKVRKMKNRLNGSLNFNNVNLLTTLTKKAVIKFVSTLV